jgi:hypothetical protein
MEANPRLSAIAVALVAACASASQAVDGPPTAPAPKPEWEPLEMSWKESGYWFSAHSEQLAWREIVESARPQLTICFASFANSVDHCRVPTPRAIKVSVHFRPWHSAPSQLYLKMERLHAGVESVPDFGDVECRDKVEEAELAGDFDSCVSHAIGEALQAPPPQPGVRILFSNIAPVLGGLGTRP